MKQKRFRFICLIPLLLFAIFAIGCGLFTRSVPRQVPTQTEPETWAVYWYLCGSDLESDWGLATDDLLEMMAQALPENVRVVIQTGGALRWHCGIDSDSIGRYLYSGDRMELLSTLPETSMGAPGTLADFLLFCNENYPADRQVVILWNHGGGSLWGAVFDERYAFASLSLPELRAALEAAPASSGLYEAVGFDACLMATVDVADLLRGHARYMIASAEVEPGYGWNYTAILRALARGVDDGGALGRVICDSYYAACVRAGEGYLPTLSVVDLEQADRLIVAYRGMGEEALLGAVRAPETYPGAFSRAAIKAQKYGPNSDDEGYVNMVDLGDFMRRAGNLLPGSGPEVLAALEECVVYQVRGFLRGRATGLACYYNLASDPEWSAAGLRFFADLGTNPAFARFTAYSLADADMMCFDNAPISQTGDGYALQIEPKEAARLTRVSLRLEMERADGRVALGQRDCAADWKTGRFDGACRTAWGALGGALVHMDPIEQAEDYTLFAVPILLGGKKNILYVSQQQGAYRMLGAREVLERGMVDKNLHPLAAGDIVEPLLPMFVGTEKDGKEIWEERPTGRVVIERNTAFAEKTLELKACRVSFVLTDCSGHTYILPVRER